jgi:hypothetical protein
MGGTWRLELSTQRGGTLAVLARCDLLLRLARSWRGQPRGRGDGGGHARLGRLGRLCGGVGLGDLGLYPPPPRRLKRTLRLCELRLRPSQLVVVRTLLGPPLLLDSLKVLAPRLGQVRARVGVGIRVGIRVRVRVRARARARVGVRARARAGAGARARARASARVRVRARARARVRVRAGARARARVRARARARVRVSAAPPPRAIADPRGGRAAPRA